MGVFLKRNAWEKLIFLLDIKPTFPSIFWPEAGVAEDLDEDYGNLKPMYTQLHPLRNKKTDVYVLYKYVLLQNYTILRATILINKEGYKKQ